MRLSPPAISQIDELPVLLRMRIAPEWQDANGHLNIRYYMLLFDQAGGPLFESFGIHPEWRKTSSWSLFDLEHHLWYLRETHVGDEVTVHCRLHQRTAKRFHGTMLLVNRTRDEVASAMEFVATGADLAARTTASIPTAVAERMDAIIEQHRKLAWVAPTSGVMAP